MTRGVIDARRPARQDRGMTDDHATAFLHQQMPLCATLGIRAIALEPAAVVLTLDWAPELCTTAGVLHGGALMTLADSAAAVCAFLNLPEGAAGTSTIEAKTNMLRAVTAGTVTATATALHAGSRTIVLETMLRDDDERPVAKTLQTQIVL